GNDKCKDHGFDQGIGDVESVEVQLKALYKFPCGGITSENSCHPPPKYADENGNCHGKGKQECGYDLWEDQVVQCIDPHDLQGIDLFGHPHGADARGDIGSHLTRHDDGGKGWCKFQDHGLSRCKGDKTFWQEGIGEVQGSLYGDHPPDEERNKNDDAHGTVDQLIDLLKDQGSHDGPFGRFFEYFPDHDEVFSNRFYMLHVVDAGLKG